MALAGCQAFRAEPPAPAEPREPVAPVETPIETPIETPAPPPRRLSDAELLLAYHARLRRLPAPEFAREHDAARQAAGKSPSDYNRVRLAMVVSLPGTPFQDPARALGLLEPVARNAQGELSPLAALLAAQIEERRRLEAGAQALQQKLDALRSLERSLIERKR